MKRFLTILIVLIAVLSFVTVNASAQQKYAGKIGVVKLKKGEPIHIACWMVVVGANASLGTDTKRGVEIAVDDKGGKILGQRSPILLNQTQVSV